MSEVMWPITEDLQCMLHVFPLPLQTHSGPSGLLEGVGQWGASSEEQEEGGQRDLDISSLGSLSLGSLWAGCHTQQSFLQVFPLPSQLLSLPLPFPLLSSFRESLTPFLRLSSQGVETPFSAGPGALHIVSFGFLYPAGRL